MPFTAGNLLDVGCGDGVFLSAVTAGDKYRFDAFGLDFDPKSVEAARSRRGLTHVYALSLEEFHDHSARNSLFFDVITFFDVLEHQDNPKSFIETVKALLSPKGGYIAGSVPNAHRLFSRYDRKMSEIDFPPHHFLYFNGSSLAGLLRREGFRDIRVLPVRLGFSDLTVLLERMCLGRISGLLRRKITGVRPAAQEGETENPAAVYCGGTIKIMKQLRNAFFAPLAAALFHAYNRRGPQLYFQARLPARQGV
jgi:SAM-dependent methyltransferase